MLSSHFHFPTQSRLAAAGAGLCFFLVPSLPVLGQEESQAENSESSASALAIHDAKFMAKKAALPALSGKNPFVLREAWWTGTLHPGGSKLIQQQLFKRNEYQFWLALPNRSARADIHVYDGEGKLVETEEVRHEGINVVSTVVRPPATGLYYVRLSLTSHSEGGEEWAVIYAYR